MNGKFIVYALMMAFVCIAASWGELLSNNHNGDSNARSGNSWSSNSSSSGSWGAGGHK
jgi:hypothetical protein